MKSVATLFVLCAISQAADPVVSPWITPKPGTPAGKTQPAKVASRIYARDRAVWVYTPPAFDPARKQPYNLLVAFDGADYTTEIPLPTILDNLLAAGKVAPTIAILVENGAGAERLGDLANRAQFASFLSGELVPWARQNWNVTHDPARTIVTGSSAGGLAAAYAAFKYPAVFGNVLAQSGAFWRGNEASNDAPYEWLASQFKQSPKLPVTFWLEVGAGETAPVLRGAGPVFLEANRRFRDVLLAKGYTVEYHEIPGAQHEPGHWRNQIADGILWLTARRKP